MSRISEKRKCQKNQDVWTQPQAWKRILGLNPQQRHIWPNDGPESVYPFLYIYYGTPFLTSSLYPCFVLLFTLYLCIVFSLAFHVSFLLTQASTDCYSSGVTSFRFSPPLYFFIFFSSLSLSLSSANLHLPWKSIISILVHSFSIFSIALDQIHFCVVIISSLIIALSARHVRLNSHLSPNLLPAKPPYFQLHTSLSPSPRPSPATPLFMFVSGLVFPQEPGEVIFLSVGDNTVQRQLEDPENGRTTKFRVRPATNHATETHLSLSLYWLATRSLEDGTAKFWTQISPRSPWFSGFLEYSGQF